MIARPGPGSARTAGGRTATAEAAIDSVGLAGWGITALLALGVMIAYADRSSISAVIANKAFVGHFGLSDTGRGWLGAAFFWSYALAQVPIGWVVDRYGAKLPYAVCFGVWCVATALSGAMSALAGLIVMRLIVGAAEAVVMPASYRWFRYSLPERHMGSAIGIFAMGNKLGTAIGAPAAAWLVVHYDWRLMFVATGLLGLIWLIPWMLAVRNDWPGKQDMAAARRQAASVPFRGILISPVVWGGIVVNFCYSYFVFYCMTWMPSYLVEQQHLSLTASGAYTFFSFIGIAIVAVAAGWGADRIIDRGGDPVRTRKLFIVAGFIGATTVLLGAWTGSLGWALFWNIFSLSCLGLASANNLALTKVTLIPRPAIGLVTGLQHMAAGLSGGVAASLSGWLLHVSGSYTVPMAVIVFFLIMGAAASIVLLRPEWSPRTVDVAGAGDA